jgi:hypothetical protein
MMTFVVSAGLTSLNIAGPAHLAQMLEGGDADEAVLDGTFVRLLFVTDVLD